MRLCAWNYTLYIHTHTYMQHTLITANQQDACSLGSSGLLGLICKPFITLLSCHVFIHVTLTTPYA